ncbi:GNAT family N-acetyltransferase [Halorubrum sp. AD140]|uniref:GNAT family N-acetyltransferase n=1 Tax=Halorubrum sp. AD140 TaxID=3050073 RepID=UPI002ACC7AA3|nr:GNAT family N-acetyltransferase [Halorubrum sp. AD140]MDZ5809854.1 GNAT family N-acetyltransferase [Halorubrum sp. AD140]
MDDLEYRPFPDERADEFGAFMRYAFSPAEGPYDPEAADDHDSIAERRGLFDATDDPVAVCAHHYFPLRIRGADREVAGLSAVASPPEHRRRGNVGRMLRESLAEYRARGVDVSVLWPFEYSFYASYGWATASRYRRLTAPPAQLGFVDDLIATDGDAAGTFRPLDESDYAVVEPVLAAMADRYDLTMAWSEEWWRERALSGWKTDPFVYGWERDGDLRGLCRYVFDDDPDDADETVMRVSDVAVADDEAWFQLLRFCRNHDSQVGEVRIRAPPDAPLLDLVEDPRAVDCEVRTGPMVRVVDVTAALEALDPDPGVEATVSLAVEDPLASWNDGVVRVTVGGGSVAVDGLDAESRDADAAVDVGALSQLYVGYRSVDALLRAGMLSGGGGTPLADAAADALRALFPPRTTHLREGF